MVTKTVSISTTTRDENGNAISETTCEGQTEDNGLTVTMGIGNLPEIQNVLPGDIVRRVSTVNITQPALVSVVEDGETGLQTITFAE